MDKSKGIYWLASFPKSGNTWFRIVLANVLNRSPELDNLDNINTGAIASSRVWIDNILGFDSGSLTCKELNQLLPAVYNFHHTEAKKIGYHKIHHAYTYLDKDCKIPLIPIESCFGAIYIIRNPLDVAISFANHSSCSIDHAVAVMGSSKNTLGANIFGQGQQIAHQLTSWSQHVESWTTAPGMNILPIRYEDMKMASLETFTKAMAFLRIDVSQEELSTAINNASIEKLQYLEEKSGFKERPVKVERFFRKGIVGDWEAQLSAEQIRRVVRDHAVVMEKHGYLDESLMSFF